VIGPLTSWSEWPEQGAMNLRTRSTRRT
jgi:hypothetical protein